MMNQRTSPPIVIKKYGNRRLYDTRQSRYVTVNELVEVIRRGDDVRVIDAKSGEDLTQATLVQMILDGRGAAAFLPVSLLTQLVRMGDDALAEFLGRYMSYALELYLQAKQGAQTLAPWNPFASLPFTAASDVARFFGAPARWPGQDRAAQAPVEPVSGQGAASAGHAAGQHSTAEMAALRRELDELKTALGASAGARPKGSRRSRRR